LIYAFEVLHKEIYSQDNFKFQLSDNTFHKTPMNSEYSDIHYALARIDHGLLSSWVGPKGAKQELLLEYSNSQESGNTSHLSRLEESVLLTERIMIFDAYMPFRLDRSHSS
jgi:hypothetical protein